MRPIETLLLLDEKNKYQNSTIPQELKIISVK